MFAGNRFGESGICIICDDDNVHIQWPMMEEDVLWGYPTKSIGRRHWLVRGRSRELVYYVVPHQRALRSSHKNHSGL